MRLLNQTQESPKQGIYCVFSSFQLLACQRKMAIHIFSVEFRDNVKKGNIWGVSIFSVVVLSKKMAISHFSKFITVGVAR